jgi:phosphatidylglycerol:prolipoprotein diacylglycerol transferase
LQALKYLIALENWDRFVKDPIDNLIGFSGLTFYGGLICGGAGCYICANKNGIKPLTMLDIGGPGMMLAYAVGRIGCQMSGDGDWGIPNLSIKTALAKLGTGLDVVVQFPHNVKWTMIIIRPIA